jgi:predicted transcriptional regulator
MAAYRGWLYTSKKNNVERKKIITKPHADSRQVWESIAKNYEMVEGAQLSNSFIILMGLSESKEPLNTTQISQIIALNTGGQIYKISATLKDSLEHRLKREGYVKSTDLPNKSLYSITPKGKKLLKGWIAFLSAYS